MSQETEIAPTGEAENLKELLGLATERFFEEKARVKQLRTKVSRLHAFIIKSHMATGMDQEAAQQIANEAMEGKFE